MRLNFRQAHTSELDTALILLRQSAQMLSAKKVNQWKFWLNPTEEKINWIKEGFENNEFYFVESDNRELIGMFRLLDKDELYWGVQSTQANYIHSLVVDEKFAGKQFGYSIIKKLEQQLINKGIFRLRLDCNAENPALCKYYEKQGFEKVGEKQMPHSLNNLYEKELLSDFPLRLLIGQWKGKGNGIFPTIDSFKYDEELRFEFIPEKERLFYFQKAMFENTNELAHIETGFIIKIDNDNYELNNAQSGGRNETFLVKVAGKTNDSLKLNLIQINNDKKGLVKSEREIFLKGDKLFYNHRMQTAKQPMQTHLEATLLRQ